MLHDEQGEAVAYAMTSPLLLFRYFPIFFMGLLNVLR